MKSQTLQERATALGVRLARLGGYPGAQSRRLALLERFANFGRVGIDPRWLRGKGMIALKDWVAVRDSGYLEQVGTPPRWRLVRPAEVRR
jgi:hypothetical protein